MKKITLFVVAAIIATFAWAQKPLQGARQNFFEAPQKTLVGKVDTKMRSLDKTTARKQLRKAKSDYVLIESKPAGELKKYSRAGSYLYVENNSLNIGTQSGSVDVVFAEDGKTVYIKDILMDGSFGTWVEGTLNDEGTLLTIPVPQNLYYVSNYDACIALGAINNYRTWDQTTTEITYTVSGNTISLNGFTSYNRTLGAFWTDDQTLQVYGEWNTVFTLKEEKHYDVVTPPAGLATTTYPFSTTINASTPYETTVEVGWDGSDVYIQGLVPQIPEAWVKGTLSGTAISFPITYVGTYNDDDVFVSGYDGTNTPANFGATYNADEEIISFQGSVMIITDPDYVFSYLNFLNGGLIGTPPTPVEVPEDLVTKVVPLVGDSYDGTSWDLDVRTVEVGWDGDDVYIKGLLPDVPDGWVKGTRSDNIVTIPIQYVGKDTRYGSNTFITGYNESTRSVADAQLYYLDDEDVLLSITYIFSNGRKDALAYNNYYDTYLTIGNPSDVTEAQTVDGTNYYTTYYDAVYNRVADENTTVYTALLNEDNTWVNLTEVESKVIPAGNAVILKSDRTNIELAADGINETVLPNNSLLGTDVEITVGTGVYYVLGAVDDEVGFYKFSGETLTAGKAYLQLPEGAASKISISFGNEATAISSIAAAKGNGNAIYNLSGQRVAKTQKGLYIVNGKKVVIK